MKNKELDGAPPAKRGRWGQERRLEFIDSRLYWEGRLNRSALTEFFGISVPQASLDLAEYQALAPANAIYDRVEKAYVATPEFRPVLTDESSSRYLAELYALSTGVISPDISFFGWIPQADVVRHPTRHVPQLALRLVLRAIRERKTITIVYQSMQRSDPSSRVISPHALGYDGYRWHVRAFCHSRKDFRDFVFARILHFASGGASTVDAGDDEEWNHMLDIVIGPHPSLEEARRRVIALDYGMADDRLTIRTRQALGFYLLKRLGLDKPIDPERPHEQQIVLINREELEPYLKALQAIRQEQQAQAT